MSANPDVVPVAKTSPEPYSVDMVGLAVAAWLALQVQGTGSCPSPGDVEEKLAPLLPEGFMTSSADLATIAEEADGALSVSLARPDGKSVARRRLPRAATCAEQAQTVAVALAVWEAQIHPEVTLRLERLVAPAPPSAVAPPPQRAPVIQRAVASEPARPLAWGVGGAALAGWQPGSFAPGGRLDGVLQRPSSAWRARLTVVGLGTHAESLAPGEARWWRLYFGLGADYAFPLGGRWDLTLGAAAVLGFATVEGAGFTSDRATRTTDWGIESLLRVDRRLGAVRPWLGLSVVTWLRRQTLDVTGTASSLVLPVAEPMLALGADFYGPP